MVEDDDAQFGANGPIHGIQFDLKCIKVNSCHTANSINHNAIDAIGIASTVNVWVLNVQVFPLVQPFEDNTTLSMHGGRKRGANKK